MKWNDHSSAFVSSRYNKLAPIYPIFEWIFALPPGIRTRTVDALTLKKGDTVIEIGCGTGRNLALLRDAVGDEGNIIGVEVSEKMLEKARVLKLQNKWENVELICADAAKLIIAEKLNGVLFSLSYATMTARKEVLENLWGKLSHGSRVVIMDAQFPTGFVGTLMIPVKPVITLFLKASVLGNPYIKPIEELKEITKSQVAVEEIQMKTYFIACAVKV